MADFGTMAEGTLNVKQRDTVYIPVGLSSFQRDLIEILIKLHKNSIFEQLTDSDLLGVVSEDSQYLTTSDLNILFKRNVLSAQNHPYLLVEHYMPKTLLLMESHERLLLASDKFNKFDKILTSLQDQKLNLIIVGHNIKELDLIEAFLLGRDLAYKRYSGRKLYDDSVPDEPVPQIEKKNKEIDDYAPKPKPLVVKNQLTLHLITTEQLNNTVFSNIDGIISFDPTLDEKESNIEYLRGISGNYIPLIKLIVLNSDPHAAILGVESGFDWLVDRKLVVTREYDDIFGINFNKVGEFFKNLKNGVFSEWPLQALPPFKKATKEQILQKLNDFEFNDEKEGNKRVKLEEIIVPEKLTIKEYKSLLARLTIERINKIELRINENKEKLKPLRIRSTIAHNAEDMLKLKVAALFKESNSLKEEVVAAEKKHDRLEFEYETLKKTQLELQEKLEGTVERSQEELDSEIEELKKALEILRLNNNEIDGELIELRTKYQTVTSEAAELSTRAKAVKATNEALLKKLNGNGLKLRSLKNEEVKLTQLDIVDRLTREAKFLQIYNDRLAGAVKEKVSNLNVGRNGRVHRSTTPYS